MKALKFTLIDGSEATPKDAEPSDGGRPFRSLSVADLDRRLDRLDAIEDRIRRRREGKGGDPDPVQFARESIPALLRGLGFAVPDTGVRDELVDVYDGIAKLRGGRSLRKELRGLWQELQEIKETDGNRRELEALRRKVQSIASKQGVDLTEGAKV